MKLLELPGGDKLHHYQKSLVLCFAGPRDVLSTGPIGGGFRTNLQAVFNNDCNPGAGMSCELRADTYEEHSGLHWRLTDLGLDPKHCTGLSTAASMDHVAIRSMSYDDFTVTAIVTGGIRVNGSRVGDPAVWHEKAGISHSTTPGTINIILHIDAALSPGALARALVTCTEAKTAALQELLAPSRYSHGIATGSGTDGTILVANPLSSTYLTNAGKHCKLGEYIGKTVKEAVKEALNRQSGLCPASQHDIRNQSIVSALQKISSGQHTGNCWKKNPSLSHPSPGLTSPTAWSVSVRRIHWLPIPLSTRICSISWNGGFSPRKKPSPLDRGCLNLPAFPPDTIAPILPG
ncbi:MAG: adenosylcobinamide amidohydrolase [Anaerosacchariphilus sp.]